MGKQWKQWQTLFSWAQKSLQMVTAAMKLRHSLEKSYDRHRQHIKKQRHHFANKNLSSQSYGYSSSHVWMWELDHIKGWMLKNWCFCIVVLDCKEIKPVNPKGNQPWIMTYAEGEASILWPLDSKSQLIKEDPDAGKDRRQEKGATEDKIIGCKWVWPSSWRWWRTGKPGVLQSMGLQRVGHDCQSVLLMFSSRSFIVLGLTFRSLIHFEFIFVYGVRKRSSFILLHVVDQFSQ